MAEKPAHPSYHAKTRPDHPAVIMAGSRRVVTYRELDDSSNRGAQLFRSLGLKTGDGIAIWLHNDPSYFTICWAAQRSGLYFTPISTHLTAAEAAYVVQDCGARVLITSAAIGAEPARLVAERPRSLPGVDRVFTLGEALPCTEDWFVATEAMPATPIKDEEAGQYMVYSSGTTGRPKGIKFPLPGGPPDTPPPQLPAIPEPYMPTAESVCLGPAPIYHAAPLVYGMGGHRVGCTMVIMEHFDAEDALRAIERYRVTHTQMVPTMFVRLLKLPDETRRHYDLSSLKYVLHAAAPCPVPVKHAMMAWWGPILYEYYAGSEANGRCSIAPEEWLRKPGSVGRAKWGTLHICEDDGKELPTGTPGLVYFEWDAGFQYHNDPEKTAQARHPQHQNWSTLGDIGYVDDDGYLFLTDRKAFMIISGGVNIYPQEVENLLITHPKVADVAVIGIPNEDFGEEVKAVVQPIDWTDATPDFAEELITFCRSQLSHIKCPRSVDFDRALPRQPTGKLYKRVIRDRYWTSKGTTRV